MTGKKKDDDNGEINEDGERPNFALVSMFDITQTEAITPDCPNRLDHCLLCESERERDLAILDNAPTEPPNQLNDEEEAALAREFARERAEEEQFALV